MTLPGTPTKRRLLFLLPFAPRLDATHGGGRAIAQLLARLATSHHIALLYLRAEDEPPLDETLQKQCDLVEEIIRPGQDHSFLRRCLWYGRVIAATLNGKPKWVTDCHVPAYAARADALAKIWRPDVVQIEYHVMGQYLSALHDCPAPRVLTEHEPGAKAADELRRSHRGIAQLKHYLNMLAWRKFERNILGKVQAVVVFTELDRKAIEPLARSTPIVCIPLATVIPERLLDPLGCSPPSLLFVGNFIHPPNVDAALRLITSIFPRVWALLPEATLHIVGDCPPLSLRQLAGQNIVITGFVPDVTPYLERAALVVVPLRLGGGMRVKVLESLAAGKATVASRLSVEGLALTDGEQIVLAESDQQFCDSIIELLSDPDRRSSLGKSAGAWARMNLNWEKPAKAYEQLYQRLIGAASHSVL